MQWPDHTTVHDDARLAEALEAADGFLNNAIVDIVLRHVPGRRVTALATVGGDTVVVKVFKNPRARGNHRRLERLRAAGLGELVPRSLGHDPSGRVGVLSFRPGVVLDQLADEPFVAACGRAGSALGALHRSGAALDRAWTLDDELDQLRRRAPISVTRLVDAVDAHAAWSPPGDLVPSHRDCHPRQLIADSDTVAWIDLDDCAMAPAGLDVGNMLGQLTREGILGRRNGAVTEAARSAFLEQYEWDGDDRELLRWELLTLTRLCGLAETRHESPAERDSLLSIAEVHLARLAPADARLVAT